MPCAERRSESEVWLVDRSWTLRRDASSCDRLGSFGRLGGRCRCVCRLVSSAELGRETLIDDAADWGADERATVALHSRRKTPTPSCTQRSPPLSSLLLRVLAKRPLDSA